MNVKEKLLEKGFIENIDYTLIDNILTALPKTRMVDAIIHHPEVVEVTGPRMETVDGLYKLNPNAILVAGVTAYDETIQVEQSYTEMLPDLESVKMECIGDLALAISEFLADKQDLIDHENDYINICDNKLVTFAFKNIIMPNADTLLSCEAAALAKNNQAAINKESLDFLIATDYHVIKCMELGVELDPTIKAARAEARAKIVH